MIYPNWRKAAFAVLIILLTVLTAACTGEDSALTQAVPH